LRGVEGPGLELPVVRAAAVDEQERELVVRVREAIDLFPIRALECEPFGGVEELIERPVPVSGGREAALTEEVEVDVLEPRDDPERVRDDLSLVCRRLERARIEVATLSVGQRRL
jgi:hypothetical protein